MSHRVWSTLPGTQVLVLCSMATRYPALKHLNAKSPELITINRLEQVAITFSCKAVLDVINEPRTKHTSHPKSFIRVDSTTADSWIMKIAAPSLTGKSLDRLFFSLLVIQKLGRDRACL